MKKILTLCILTSLLFGINSCSKDGNCPTGYSGAGCSNQNTPTQIQITKITVTNFPSINPSTGNDWNATEQSGHADIYPVVSDNSGNIIYNGSSSYIVNASNQINNVFTPSSPLVITSVNNSYTFTLFNHNNVTADDNMGAIIKLLYYNGNSFPTTISIDNGANGLSMQLSVQYSF